MIRFYKKFFTSNLRIQSSFFTYILLIFIFFEILKQWTVILVVFKVRPVQLNRFSVIFRKIDRFL
jgi:hypothetical protein